MTSVAERSPWLFDAVVQFLKSENWSTPIQQFIDRSCVIFTNEEENALSYTAVHDDFRELMEGLLEGFLSEMGVSAEDFFLCCIEGQQKDQFLQGVVQYILALDDFETFRKLMTKRNVALTEEALGQAVAAVEIPDSDPSPLAEIVSEPTEPADVITPETSHPPTSSPDPIETPTPAAQQEEQPKAIPLPDLSEPAPMPPEPEPELSPETEPPVEEKETPTGEETQPLTTVADPPSSSSSLSSLSSLPSISTSAPILSISPSSRRSGGIVLPGVKPRRVRVMPGEHFSVLDVVESASSRPRQSSKELAGPSTPNKRKHVATETGSSGPQPRVGVLRKLVHSHFGKKSSPGRRRSPKAAADAERALRARKRKMQAVFTDLEVNEG